MYVHACVCVGACEYVLITAELYKGIHKRAKSVINGVD